MKKISILLIALIAICLSVSAVSAFDFNFNFGTDSNSDGGSIDVNNNQLTIQDIKYTIPDGYKENESGRVLAEDASKSFGDGAKVTTCELNKDNDTILIKVFFGDGEFENVKPANPNAVNKTIGGEKGFLTELEDGVLYNYQKDNKLVEISAPNEEAVESVLKV